MAGIGFDLLRLVNQGTYKGLLSAYGLSTLMSSGPSIFILIGIGVVCFINYFLMQDHHTASQFLALIIYLFSSSMIVSSFLQYTFFRFMADKIYVNDYNSVAPNYIGVLTLQLLISVCLCVPTVLYLFPESNHNFKILIISNFVILTMIWISTVLLTGIKSYKQILWAFSLGYITMILVHLLSNRTDLNFLLFDFLLAQVILLVILLHAILDYYPTNKLIRFSFLKHDNLYFSLIISNFLFTVGFWIDKYIFWFNPNTSYPIYAPLRAAPIYDFPMFIAYTATIPAMAVFLFRIEAKFSMIYPEFMKAIFGRKTLDEITAVRNELTSSGRETIISLFKTQYTVVILMLLSMTFIFSVFGVISLYLDLLFILIIATSLNVILWGIINILYYMTRYIQAVYVSLIYAFSNTLFTLISIEAGPYYYGYGLCLSLLLSIACALLFLNKSFNDLEYYTFMMTD